MCLWRGGLRGKARGGARFGKVCNNGMAAGAFAWQGAERDAILDVLNEGDAGAFQFLTGELRWRGRSITVAEVQCARRDFAHSFGSCSFAEPIADLQALGWL